MAIEDSLRQSATALFLFSDSSRFLSAEYSVTRVRCPFLAPLAPSVHCNPFENPMLQLEARVGIEPTNAAFAEPCLTTWLPRRRGACKIVEFVPRASIVFRRALFRLDVYFPRMPELAEVEFYRRRWDAGLGQTVLRAHLHGKKRVARGLDVARFCEALAGATFVQSEGHGKRMLFRFSTDIWLGLHLGMTGKLLVEGADFQPGKHDHLALFQKERTLVFHDPRQFGRIQFSQGKEAPSWWKGLPPQPHEAAFTRAFLDRFFARRKMVPVKAALLMQEAFAGIGNWMADEILWRARVNPSRRVRSLSQDEAGAIWKQTRWVSREAIKRIAPAHADPPKGWFFNERWGKRGVCPRDGTPLKRAEVGGRTTAWCPVCQPK